ncbi:glucan 1,3-beta-glucosidase [Colletotrichum musicola]|uniref:Glucan 1,3-beta-glucosidase n=1 Tax=Colletotrichum musicola TaxID=2175873 RepID=A0A8H6J0R6_9PEZI|nr:glucan 1,3-beta-glucosidase [Colletotrichum musicola]
MRARKFLLTVLAVGTRGISLSNVDSTESRPLARDPAVGNVVPPEIQARQDADDYWLPKFATSGKAPLMPGDYEFFRDVKKFGAKGDGETDDSDAINAAVSAGNRCGKGCSSTFASGALVYFPPGTYKICKPIIQLYHTQFVGNPNSHPVIKGCSDFKGIALIDANPYGPGGINWYVNQNQFFRQVRNFVLDMRDMPKDTRIQDDLPIAPTGIHWQVSQATSLQNITFKMPRDSDATHVGIVTENGSGGFVSGSQQYTAHSLTFENCRVAVEMIWDWGFNWQRVRHRKSPADPNTELRNVRVGVLMPKDPAKTPNLVLDGLFINNVETVIQAPGEPATLNGTLFGKGLEPYAVGKRYNGTNGTVTSGFIKDIPNKPNGLLERGKLFLKSKPQYEKLGAEKILDAVSYGISNDGTGDQTTKINSFLKDAVAAKKAAYFPAGIYQVEGTVFIPKDSTVIGSGWSQIMGTGKYFGDIENPKVMIKVGNEDEAGTLEISDMLFTVKGATAGAILMEWNIREINQGSVGMWDSHFRVGGAAGTDLDFANCPKGQFNEKCIAASLLFHLRRTASGYFENVWFWTGDHDNDMNLFGESTSSSSQISVYTGRGVLIESKGPSWFLGGGSEHHTLYQYQLYKASGLYMGHFQTETPYYQPDPVATKPFAPGKFPGDPTFDDCAKDEPGCVAAWGMRVTDSEDIWVHGAGLYSFFSNYEQDCIPSRTCQQRILEVEGANRNFSISAEDNQKWFTSEISVWVPPEGDTEPEVVYLGPEIYSSGTNTAHCTAPCVMVLPPSALPSTTTISIPDYTTSLQVGPRGSATTTTITITIPAITTDSIRFSNVNVTTGQIASSFQPLPSISLAPQNITVTEPNGTVVTRTVVLPPWPAVTDGPPQNWSSTVPGAWNGTAGIRKPALTTNLTFTGPATATVTFDAPESSRPRPFVCPTTAVVTVTGPTTGDFTGIKGWKIKIPPGVYGPKPPPPPFLQYPPGFTFSIEPTLPVFPKFTIGFDRKPTLPPRPAADLCKPMTATLCPKTLSYDYTVSGGQTITTKTSTITPRECPTITGCNVNDYTPTIKESACKARRTPPPLARVRPRAEFDYKNCVEGGKDAIIYIKGRTPKDADAVRAELDIRSEFRAYTAIESKRDDIPNPEGGLFDGGLFLFFYVQNLGESELEHLQRKFDEQVMHTGRAHGAATQEDPMLTRGPQISYIYQFEPRLQAYRARRQQEIDALFDAVGVGKRGVSESSKPSKRDSTPLVTPDWARSQISTPQKVRRNGQVVEVDWLKDEDTRGDQVDDPVKQGTRFKGYKYWREETDDIKRQSIYLMEDDCDETHPELVDHIERLSVATHYQLPTDEERRARAREAENGGVYNHGTGVAGHAGGRKYGVVPAARLVCVRGMNSTETTTPVEHDLHKLLVVIEDVLQKPDRRGRSVVNFSRLVEDLAFREGFLPYNIIHGFALLIKILDALGVPFVMGSGNSAVKSDNTIRSITGIPAMLGDPEHAEELRRHVPTESSLFLPNIIVVGAVGVGGGKDVEYQEADWMTTFAPGHYVLTSQPSMIGKDFVLDQGTSLATPIVAGVVAYIRAQDSRWQKQLEEPRNVKSMVRYLTRKLKSDGDLVDDPTLKWEARFDGAGDGQRPFIWNGEVFGKSCLRNHGDADLQGVCPDIPDSLGGVDPNDRSVGERVLGSGGAVPMPGPVQFEPGPPGPTCTTGCGDHCTGYYCDPTPRATPPDFFEPTTTSAPGPPRGPVTDAPAIPPARGCVTSVSCETEKIWPKTCRSSTSCWSDDQGPTSACSYDVKCQGQGGRTAFCQTVSTSCWGGATATPAPEVPVPSQQFKDDVELTCGSSCKPPLFARRDRELCQGAADGLESDAVYRDNSTKAGSCEYSRGYGCGVWVEGSGCRMRGDEMRYAFSQMFVGSSCDKCQRMKFGSNKECAMVIDYVTGCDGNN